MFATKNTKVRWRKVRGFLWQFARFCGYALGSLEETKSSLIDGRDRAYLDEKLCSRLCNLARAAERATKGPNPKVRDEEFQGSLAKEP
jgi:hypothetical protein